MNEPLTPAEARKLLSKLLNAGAPVRFSPHGLDEMVADNITTAEALTAAKYGRIFEPADYEKGTYRYRVHHGLIVVVVAFDWDDEGEAVGVAIVTAWRKKR